MKLSIWKYGKTVLLAFWGPGSRFSKATHARLFLQQCLSTIFDSIRTLVVFAFAATWPIVVLSLKDPCSCPAPNHPNEYYPDAPA